jgi:hypothetical protein
MPIFKALLASGVGDSIVWRALRQIRSANACGGKLLEIIHAVSANERWPGVCDSHDDGDRQTLFHRNLAAP